MYYYIKGLLAEITLTYAVVEAHGVGYQVLVASNTITRVSSGREVLFYTTFIVREQSQTLFGFLTREEKELFELLIGISGIGGKTALALLGSMNQERLVQAVHSNDILQLSKVPGIGKKTAEKLILELKGKFKELLRLQPTSIVGATVQDALAALMGLGYSQTRAEQAVEKARTLLPESAELSELISVALQSSAK